MKESTAFRKVMRIFEIENEIVELQTTESSIELYSFLLAEKNKLCDQFRYSMPFLSRKTNQSSVLMRQNIETSHLKIFEKYLFRNVTNYDKTYRLRGLLVLFTKKVLKTDTPKLYVLNNLSDSLINILPLFPKTLKSAFKDYASKYPKTSTDFLCDLWYPGYSKTKIVQMLKTGKCLNILKMNIFHIYNSEETFPIHSSAIFTSTSKEEGCYEEILLSSKYPFFSTATYIVREHDVLCFDKKKLTHYILFNDERIDVPLSYLVHNCDVVILDPDYRLYYLNIVTNAGSIAYNNISQSYIISNFKVVIKKDKIKNIRYLLPILQGDEIETIRDKLQDTWCFKSLKTIRISEETLNFIKSTGYKKLVSLMFPDKHEMLLSSVEYYWDGKIKIRSNKVYNDHEISFLRFILRHKINVDDMSDKNLKIVDYDTEYDDVSNLSDLEEYLEV